MRDVLEPGPPPTSSPWNQEREASAVQAARLSCGHQADTSPCQASSSLPNAGVAVVPAPRTRSTRPQAGAASARGAPSRELASRPSTPDGHPPGSQDLPVLHRGCPLCGPHSPSPMGRDTGLHVLYSSLEGQADGGHACSRHSDHATSCVSSPSGRSQDPRPS